MAEIIAGELGAEAHSVSMPLLESADILFIGGGVYAWKAARNVLNYINGLDPQKVGQIVAFGTTGMMSVVVKQIAKAAKKRGIPVSKNKFCLKLFLQGHTLLGRKGGVLKEKQIAKIKKFANAAVSV
jgi:hypothetical protein